MQTTIPCAVPATDAKPPAGKPEPLDIPDCLKVPATERKAAWKGRKSTKPKADKLAGDLTLPRSIESAGKEILKEQKMKKEETKAARLRALRENKVAAQKQRAVHRDKPPESCPDELIEKIDKVVREVKEKKRSKGAPLPTDPKKQEAAVGKLARKEVPIKKKPQLAAKDRKTIGGVARAAILAGKDNEGALAAVMKAFPKCNSNLGCMNWYRNDLRKKGELKSLKK